MPSGVVPMCGQSVMVSRTYRHEVGVSSSNSVYFVTVLPVLSRIVEKAWPSREVSIL
jgi:hypothetical protein